jgi:Ca2+-transporting ATPase
MSKGPFEQSAEEVLEDYHSTPEGLSDQEAASRLLRDGPNELASKKPEPRWKVFLRQFLDPLIIVLLVAALVTAVIEPGSFDWVVIGAIVLINAIIGYIQEEKAKHAMEKLRQMASPKASVFRGGVRKEIDSKHIVVGDAIHLEAGMKVPADMRLFEEANLIVNESPLTGESLPVEKDIAKLHPGTPLAERANMCYMGTVIESGRAIGVVTEAGMRTELGKIAGMIDDAPSEDTPLQDKLKKLGKRLGILVMASCALIFGLEIVRALPDISTESLIEMFKAAVSLAVAAIPEGLPTVVTISLALGIRSMAKRNAIVRKLPVVETLGSATVICTDKTGTLTQGIMSVDWIYSGAKIYRVEGKGYEPTGRFLDNNERIDPPLGNKSFRRMAECSALCADATLTSENGEWKVAGDTTEGALLVMARRAGFDEGAMRKQHPRRDEIAFDPKRKLMSTANLIDGRLIGYTKGAPERVLSVCSREMIEDHILPLDEGRKRSIIATAESLARQGYRSLGLAFSPEGKMEQGMVFVGIAGIRDQIRAEAKDAVAKAKGAGIRVIMITGDHHLTAASIGKELGIIRSEEESINCLEMDSMEEARFKDVLRTISVFARASPEHKVRIVKGLREQGEIVAMTGDGVNDAPALKTASIGISMGITGTDVAKEASDMILADDNFATIVAAVEEGRTIYANIRKAIQFLLSCNMGEVLVMLIAIAIGWPLPLLALQILWMNLVTDSLPALALVTEPKEPDIMKRPPRDPSEGALTKDMIISIAISASIITIGSLILFRMAEHRGLDVARTVTLVSMVMFQMWTALASRSTTHTMSEIGWFTNKKLLLAILLGIALVIPVIYVPFLQEIFGTASLNLADWAEILVVSSLGLIVVEIWEFVNRRWLKMG